MAAMTVLVLSLSLVSLLHGEKSRVNDVVRKSREKERVTNSQAATRVSMSEAIQTTGKTPSTHVRYARNKHVTTDVSREGGDVKNVDTWPTVTYVSKMSLNEEEEEKEEEGVEEEKEEKGVEEEEEEEEEEVSTLQEYHDVMVCPTNEERCVINTSACPKNDSVAVYFYLAIQSFTTVELRTDPRNGVHSQAVEVCRWKVTIPYKGMLNVTMDTLREGERSANLTMSVSQNDEQGQTLPGALLVDGATPTDSVASFLSSFPKDVLHRFQYTHATAASPSSPATVLMTLHYVREEGPYVRDLPFVYVSESSGYVTSPGFDAGYTYPNDYDGRFRLDVSANQSLMYTFAAFSVQGDKPDCRQDHLDVTPLLGKNDAPRQRMCGYVRKEAAYPHIVRSSLLLSFHTDRETRRSGFKMLFVLIPRSLEPQLVLPSDIINDSPGVTQEAALGLRQLSQTKALLNCSVAHFARFQPLVACDMVQQCLGGEDERGCPYLSDECGSDAVDAGAKCYRLATTSAWLTWRQAEHRCTQQGHTLATVAVAEELALLKRLVSARGNASRVFVGAQLSGVPVGKAVAGMYQRVWQWADGRTAFFSSLPKPDTNNPPVCSVFVPEENIFQKVSCGTRMEAEFVCEWEKQSSHQRHNRGLVLDNNKVSDVVKLTGGVDAVWNQSVFVRCRPAGHVTRRDFLSWCDFAADCGVVEDAQRECSTECVTLPMFACERGGATVHFSHVCDGVPDCGDESDESFCRYSPSPNGSRTCLNGKCIPDTCDGKLRCFDITDRICDDVVEEEEENTPGDIFPPGVVHMDGKGGYRVTGIQASDSSCPPTHFQCPAGFCLPVYLRCNGVDDCTGREDEMGCDSYTCPGYFRCRGSKICLHADDVCDGVPQCPQQDDELLCDLSCPHACRCQGLAFVCSLRFSVNAFPAVRYLDATGTGMTLADVNDSEYLVNLRLSRNGINTVPPYLILRNLRELDLSWNQLKHIDMQHFVCLRNLKVLILTGNPIARVTSSEIAKPWRMIFGLEILVLSQTALEVYTGSAFQSVSQLKTLNMSRSLLRRIDEDGFESTPQLTIIDVTGTPLKEFPKGLLRNLSSLKEVYADHFKLCCNAMLPVGFRQRDCHAPEDVLTSCEDLLRHTRYRVCLWIFASLSLVGNAGSFAGRLYLQERDGEKLSSFSVFVTNLSVADFLMGVYLAVIGVADQVYYGRYLWHDDEWKQSVGCQLAGFLSLLSSETSAFIICLITLDRVLVLRFPFGRYRFRRCSAMVACAVVWTVGLFLAAVPLLPVVGHWGFYSQTSICTPLPFNTSDAFEDYQYAFGVMILLNLVLFVFIAAGQAVIYRTVLTKTLSSSADHRTRDATIARRLSTVVVSDFLCWFPVGLLGLLAATGTPISSEVSVAVAIFVLPFNSALNPFLYTFNVFLEKRRKAREAALTRRLEARAPQHGGPVVKASAL